MDTGEAKSTALSGEWRDIYLPGSSCPCPREPQYLADGLSAALPKSRLRAMLADTKRYEGRPNLNNQHTTILITSITLHPLPPLPPHHLLQ